ncbi:hypothetical protein BB559_003484 [Furculomyces boomerangus]|uniref:Fumarylacetoacetase-like C-terminal domain-containing protein n=2 Tax=Harpellales TaxID=61421 RepID=A0A2T9YL63_9FUNG|nr:hypothetical protein BB559_004378 [Furculomyces boomerangus]PVU93068.1 hypothetical protein BB559_003484 [Furculomyces boomerangus]PWA02011.1 hypothetical protein BB558_001870 [Smittium angustum]
MCADFIRRGRKIIAIGKNYVDHAKEMNSLPPKEPMFFLKPTTSYISSPGKILLPKGQLIHHEIEMGVVIGKGGRDIPADNAFDHVSGYTLALDLTARDLQDFAKKKGYPWTMSKGFDHFTPISSFISKEKIKDPNNVRVWTSVNGKVRQDDSTSLMIFKIPTLIEYVSKVMTLEEGDLILTGTPKGVGPVESGDKVVAGLDVDGVELASLNFDVGERQ